MGSPRNVDHTPAGRSRGLSRELVVATALDYIDAHGTSDLSMRNLAQRLGVEAMSIYHHVRGREDLLEGVVGHLLTTLNESLDQQPWNHWQGFLQTLAHESRQITIEHPNAFPLVATRHPSAPWLRPPLRSLELVSTFLTTLTDQGFSDQQAVDTYRAFSSFLLGQLLLEASVRGAETAPAEEPLDEGEATISHEDGGLDLTDYPDLQRLRQLLSQDRSQEEFEVSLENLLDRIDRQVSQ